MSQILVVAEHDGAHLNLSTARCVTCAAGLPSPEVTVVVLASEPAAVAAAAAHLTGVQRVLAIAGAAFAHPLAATLAPELAALAPQFTHVLAPSTTFGKDLLPRVAGILGVPQVSDIMAVLGERAFRRPIYAGNALLTIEVSAGFPVLATVRCASFKAAEAGPSEAPIEARSAVTSAPSHTRYVGVTRHASDRPDLQTALRVVSGGRALGSADNFQLLYRLADKLGAAVGASRAAVDAGYAPNDLQVGQTGKIIAPELYMAFGISGAIQHLTGIKDARTIVAVNKDSEAPIFESADFGLVGDIFKIIPELEALL